MGGREKGGKELREVQRNCRREEEGREGTVGSTEELWEGGRREGRNCGKYRGTVGGWKKGGKELSEVQRNCGREEKGREGIWKELYMEIKTLAGMDDLKTCQGI